MIGLNQIPNKEKGEKIMLHVRRHWFIFLRAATVFIFLYLLPAIVYVLLLLVNPLLLEGEISSAIITVIFLSYYLILIALSFTVWTEMYLDVWTVTNRKIINREQHGLFSREVSELDMKKIQDVTAEQKGIFATLFHYGDVYIQSAGTRGRFVFEQIPNPYKTAKLIQKLDDQAKKISQDEKKS